MLDLNALSVFLSVAELGSFSEAARRLNISQPSVSQTVQAIERQFGAQLFIRQGRSIRLTDAGRLLQEMGREVLIHSRRLEETMLSFEQELVGEVNLGCSANAAKYFLPQMVARFRRNFPQVRVNIMIYNPDELLRMLLDGQIPIAVNGKQIGHTGIESLPLMIDEIVLIVPAGHRWLKDGQILPEDLLQEPLILREKGARTREIFMQALQQHHISPDMLKVEMTLGDAEAVCVAVEAGLGVAFISQLAADRSLSSGSVAQVRVEGMPLSREIFLARNRRFPPTPAQSEFWCFAQTQIMTWGTQANRLADLTDRML